MSYYDSNPYMLDEPDYGEVKARIRGWDADKPELGVYWQDLDLR